MEELNGQNPSRDIPVATDGEMIICKYRITSARKIP
jgi:hypothetical protein